MEPDWKEYWADHDKEMERLVNKFVGTTCLANGRAIKDSWGKKHWYANRIRELGQYIGQATMRKRRCKRTDSERYKKYDEHELELIHASDALILEMLMIT